MKNIINLKKIFNYIILLILFSCNVDRKIKEDKYYLKNLIIQDSSDYDNNGIMDYTYIYLTNDNIVNLLIYLNENKKIHTNKLLIPLSDINSEKNNIFLNSEDNQLNIIHEYGAVRDKMNYNLYYDNKSNEIKIKNIIYVYFQNNIIKEDTIFKNVFIKDINMYHYFNIKL